jgi:dihydroorotase
VEAGKLANVPVMIDFGVSDPPLSIEELFLKHLRPGDIFTHCYAQLASGREYIVDPKTAQVKPFVWEAIKRGIIFDVGYGGISFAFSQALPAMRGGLYPHVISTDLHIGSMNAAMKDLPTTMSKFLAMGMDLQSVVKACTLTPARVIKREELGHLSVGSDADITILNLRKGRFGLFDYTGHKIETDSKLECEMTIRGGKIVYDLNGLANPITVLSSAPISSSLEPSARGSGFLKSGSPSRRWRLPG